ncbi:SGNH/GDSL hydrolase family protein [Echinicola marina]|uniref:SGNH/GDSL hydrolase family protein n=1 Tax=Echinicola marina TaxID=2859768 RepID=UPI001CF70AAA|nr:SGNH/GDSL hydrolase family protein [Echinicola marina]UCS93367.1 SGNH/GDSL hydrolase family protein [Echinicola marina]
MKKIFSLTIATFLVASIAMSQSIKPFSKGDKVAFVGNSITEAGYYETYIWLYYMTHFPDRRIEIRNVGIGGDVSGQINDRLESDALALDPDAVVITFGMNDTGYFEYNWDNPDKFADERVEKSYKDFQGIIDQLKAAPKLRKIIMSSSPYDETMENENNHFPGKSKAMERIVAFQKEEAEKQDWDFVDLYYPMEAINLKGQKEDPAFTITGPDRIHPGNGGHLVMAYLFLKAQGLEAPVAEINLDPESSSIIKEENATISNLKVEGEKLSFEYLAKSLPFPVDTVSKMWGNEQKQSLALEVVPFMEEFNREIFQVQNLSGDQNYELMIDGELIGKWTGNDLAKGINLAAIKTTPQYKQAWTVMNLANTIRNIDNKIREYYWMQYDVFKDLDMMFEDDQHAIEVARKISKDNGFARSKMETYEAMRFEAIRKTYEDQLETVADVIYKVNQPLKRKVEIRPVQ